jgi:hypothetical protein
MPAVHGVVTGLVCLSSHSNDCRGQVVAGSGDPGYSDAREVKYTHATCQTLFEP